MASHNDLGRTGERIAAEFLERDGYRILERNYTFKKAEIDLIAVKDSILSAIEVKTRTNCATGRPQEFVSNEKIRLMQLAINNYVIEHGIDLEVRFDIIAVTREGSAFRVEHFSDAFYHF